MPKHRLAAVRRPFRSRRVVRPRRPSPLPPRRSAPTTSSWRWGAAIPGFGGMFVDGDGALHVYVLDPQRRRRGDREGAGRAGSRSTAPTSPSSGWWSGSTRWGRLMSLPGVALARRRRGAQPRHRRHRQRSAGGRPRAARGGARRRRRARPRRCLPGGRAVRRAAAAGGSPRSSSRARAADRQPARQGAPDARRRAGRVRLQRRAPASSAPTASPPTAATPSASSPTRTAPASAAPSTSRATRRARRQRRRRRHRDRRPAVRSPCDAGRRCRFSDTAFVKFDKKSLGSLARIARPNANDPAERLGGDDARQRPARPSAARAPSPLAGRRPAQGRPHHRLDLRRGGRHLRAGQPQRHRHHLLVPDRGGRRRRRRRQRLAGVHLERRQHGAAAGRRCGAAARSRSVDVFVFSPLPSIEQELGALRIR